eukprot:m.20322 g.20322  ORF g.20322 m.20322 type:complete len:81 (-) comp6805_c0_seq1:713-955(-)
MMIVTRSYCVCVLNVQINTLSEECALSSGHLSCHTSKSLAAKRRHLNPLLCPQQARPNHLLWMARTEMSRSLRKESQTGP